MAETQNADELDRWAVAAASALDAKGGDRTVILRVGEVLGITDLFIITSAGNDRLVKTLVDEAEAAVAAAGGPPPLRTEGRDDRRWVLVDYGPIVVHVFLDEARRFYDLERLWADVPVLEWVDAGSST